MYIKWVVLDDPIRFRWLRHAKTKKATMKFWFIRCALFTVLPLTCCEAISKILAIHNNSWRFRRWFLKFDEPRKKHFQFNSASSSWLLSTKKLRFSFYDETLRVFQFVIARFSHACTTCQDWPTWETVFWVRVVRWWCCRWQRLRRGNIDLVIIERMLMFSAVISQ